MFRPVISTPQDTVAIPMPSNPKTHVSFRITLPATTRANRVDVVGSWDQFRTSVPLEQDKRVGMDVWKGILSHNGGLEMGSEHYYYFLIDETHPIPDPHSPPTSLVMDHRTGRLMSLLYVPIELPPSRSAPSTPPSLPETAISPCTTVSSSIFTDFSDLEFESPREVPSAAPSFSGSNYTASTTTLQRKGKFRDRLRQRLEEPRRRGLLSVSTSFLRRAYKQGEEEAMLPPVRAPSDSSKLSREEEMREMAGYLRSGASSRRSHYSPPNPHLPPHHQSVYAPQNGMQLPDMYSSLYSSEDDDEDVDVEGEDTGMEEEEEEEELATPVDETEAGQLPRYYNFDEVKPLGHGESLSCLREHVQGEVKWRREMESELGYLGSVVV